MFSQQLDNYVDKIWQTAPACVPSLEGLTEEEALLCRLAYGTLPASDALVPLEVMLDYVRHALFLRRESPFARDIPEDLFLHFVFYPRINSEDLSPCRSFFYDLLKSRIQGLCQEGAILEINRWCAEQVTYQASNDRTESPLTAYFSGIGRCGEESTFAVSVLRSAGIPARQIYVPFWAHCDDNHAWVEVFSQGKWHFLGACEPEPILNRGWFTDASSRAPVVCYREFFDFPAKAENACINRDGCCALYNVTSHYAPVSKLTIAAAYGDGAPAVGVQVVLSVVNMAAFSTVARLTTDEKGICSIDVGRVTLHAEVWTEAGCASENITVNEDCQLTLTIQPEPETEELLYFDCFAPAAVPLNRTVLTAQQQKENDEMLSRCASIRRQRIDGYYLSEYDALPQRWQKILHLAAGNADELFRLYQQANQQERSLYLSMLEAMEEKDCRDTPASLLQKHLHCAMPYRGRPHFVEEILCPRLQHEMLECWREPIEKFFTETQKKSFAAKPESLMDYLNLNFTNGNLRYYSALSVQPTASLKLGHTDEKGRRLLFVAVMRTLGVPSRLNPCDGSAEYYRDGVYHRVSSAAPAAQLELLPEAGKRFVYGCHYALSRKTPNGYQPLQSFNSDSFEFSLMPGDYRLLTTTRMPNGSQQCILSRFRLAAGEKRSVPLRLREPSPEEMLGSGAVEPFALQSENGQLVPSSQLLRGKTVLIYLDVRKEPTEHILNEIIAGAEAVRQRIASGMKLIFVLHAPSEKEDPTLQQALSAVPEAETYYDSIPSDATMLARKLFLEPGTWPLLLLSDETHRGYYGTCGYQVGTLELTLKLADCIE